MRFVHISTPLLCAALALASGVARAQAWPVKPVKILTAGSGGGNDATARVLAQGLAGPLGQQVIVENRPPAVLPDVAAKSAPDGYTLMVYSGGLWIQPFIGQVTYDPVRDFAPVSFAARSPLAIVVHPAVPVHSVKDLIAYARAHPGTLNFTTGGTGSSSHLGPELFKQMTGVNMVRVPYKSAAQEIADLLGGQVQLTFGGGATVASHIKTGKLRGIAVTSAQPSALYPDLPTVAATGVPGYECTQIFGMFAPARVPEAIVRRLSQEAVRYLHTEDARQKILAAGMETVGSTPEEFAAVIRADMARWGKLIKDAGIHED